MTPTLYIVVPCYNEEQVLPLTAPLFLQKIRDLVARGEVGSDSRVLFVDDGSKDKTWDIICTLTAEQVYAAGISLSRNRGHQNALLGGLMEAKERCDITVSMDCDGQDDIHAIDEMVREYKSGSEIVYGVRSNRDTDTAFKRITARWFYKLLTAMGAEVVYDHADYRLLSARVLRELAEYKEVNLYLRGMIPLVGFKSSCVYYERGERLAGESHYPLKKMLKLAFDGITSLSIKPLRLVASFGLIVTLLSFVGILWSVIAFFTENTVAGWASLVSLICFFSGVQLLSLGIIGEYIGKIYMETKGRPRFIVRERTENPHRG